MYDMYDVEVWFNANCTLRRSFGIFLPLLACTGQGHALARSVRSSAFSTSPIKK